jgi:hypothetical membrane protein
MGTRQEHEIDHHAVGPTRGVAVAVLAAIAGYVAIDIVLAAVRRDYSLISNAESDYGRGRDAWLMDTNFGLRALLSLAAAWVLSRSSAIARWPVWLIVVWAVSSGLLGLFPDNPPGYPKHPSGSVHLILAVIAFTAIVVATTAVSITLAKEGGWGRARPVLLGLCVVAIVAYLVLPKTLAHTHGIGGAVERTFLAAELLWLVVAMVVALTETARYRR